MTIGALTLGLGVDYSVHFGTRMEEEELNPNGTIAEWTSKTVSTTGRANEACINYCWCFCVTFLNRTIETNGISFAIAISMALISSLTLLPTP